MSTLVYCGIGNAAVTGAGAAGWPIAAARTGEASQGEVPSTMAAAASAPAAAAAEAGRPIGSPPAVLPREGPPSPLARPGCCGRSAHRAACRQPRCEASATCGEGGSAAALAAPLTRPEVDAAPSPPPEAAQQWRAASLQMPGGSPAGAQARLLQASCTDGMLRGRDLDG